jgi:hypothetical protein
VIVVCVDLVHSLKFLLNKKKLMNSLRKASLAIIFLLFANLSTAFGSYGEPTSQEQELYNKLLVEFEKITVSKKDVSDTLKSFKEPIVISFPCDATDANKLVVATITSKLVNFDDSLATHEGATTGGIYVWKCSITFSADKITINCDNGLMLNADAILKSTEKDPQVKLVEDLVIFYHELLHGQLMIDAMKSSDAWHDNTCNKKFQDELDYSYTDSNHKIITPLQTEFASQLIEDIDGIFEIEEISPEETTSGAFTKKIGSLYDYPEYVKSGISISARSYNIADIQILSQKNDIMISGHLNNNSEPGIVWLYIFAKSQEGSDNPSIIETQNEETLQMPEIPYWVKNNAKWWSDGTIGDNDFVQGIQYLINAEIIKIPQTTQGTQNTQQIPYWVKNNAKWWSDDMISDSDFVQGIQYLIKIGVMQIWPESSQQPNLTELDSDLQKAAFVSMNTDVFKKQSYQAFQAKITGRVEDFKAGTSVILIITKPDQSSYELKGVLTSNGEFIVPIMIDNNFQTGKYVVAAKYSNFEFDTTSFIVK